MRTWARLGSGALIAITIALVVHNREWFSPPLKLTPSPTATAFGIPIAKQEELFYELNQVSYFSPVGKPAYTLPLSIPVQIDLEYSPLTVVILEKGQSLAGAIDSYLDLDDVISPPFLSSILLLPPAEFELQIPASESLELRNRYNLTTILLHPSIRFSAVSPDSVNTVFLANGSAIPALSPGPYLFKRGQSFELFPVYRLYPDTYRTFMNGIYESPQSSGRYVSLDRTNDKGQLVIPVPSKLHSKKSGLEFGGVRVAIKDIYDIEGLRTSAGSPAFAEIYGKKTKTAVAIQRIQEMGCVLVGKTKTSQFATRDSTNDEIVGEQYPFSPRGDLHQGCGASSAGSACALAAYPWLDFALGSDTGGSMRVPAAMVGLYGNRPSHNAISLEGVMPLSGYMDTAGVFSRDPYIWSRFIKTWFSESPLELQSYPSFPKTLLYPTDLFSDTTTEAQMLIEAFLSNCQALFGMARQEINYTQWQKDLHLGIGETNLAGVMASWWQWTHLGEDFFQRYAGENDGRHPPLDSGSRRSWERARTLHSEQEYKLVKSQWEKFRLKWNDDILGDDPECCSRAMGGLPSYREAKLNDEAAAMSAFYNLPDSPVMPTLIAPMGSSPDYTIPIGQVPYRSVISKNVEMKTVSISLIARRGCDFMLLDMVEKLAEAGVIGKVATDRTAFPL
ncbi:hypothetical protein P7C73_g5327, partial [Tremellales sp. Uapishka_1]